MKNGNASIIFVTTVSGCIFYVKYLQELECIDSADYELGCPMEDCKNSIEDEIVQKLLI
jgi:hypothetical protein